VKVLIKHTINAAIEQTHEVEAESIEAAGEMWDNDPNDERIKFVGERTVKILGDSDIEYEEAPKEGADA
jgi:uncharacterized damage-inducible protein DinB